MKVLIYIALLFASLMDVHAAVGSILRGANIPQIVEEAVPELRFSAGNKNWSGGMYSSAYLGTSAFDSNTIYSIYASKKTLSAFDIASAVSSQLVKTFDLPTDPPSSTWFKSTPAGLSADEYAMGFINSRAEGKDMNGGNYITIEATKLDDRRYSIEVTYTCFKKE